VTDAEGGVGSPQKGVERGGSSGHRENTGSSDGRVEGGKTEKKKTGGRKRFMRNREKTPGSKGIDRRCAPDANVSGKQGKQERASKREKRQGGVSTRTLGKTLLMWKERAAGKGVKVGKIRPLYDEEGPGKRWGEGGVFSPIRRDGFVSNERQKKNSNAKRGLK